MNATAHKTEITSVRIYLTIFALLIALTGITVWVATIDLGDLNVVVALAVAAIKAALVFLFFMHLRHSPRFTWVVIAFSFGFFALLVSFTLSDVFTRGHWSPLGPNVVSSKIDAPR